MKIGDLVVLKDDAKKIIYVIEQILPEKVYIVGLNYRIRKIVSESDLIIATHEQIETENKKTQDYFLNICNYPTRNSKNYLLGTVLHIDGDKKYLDKCLELYKTIGIYANGTALKEEEMHTKIKDLVNNLAPDIVVITGHDVYNQKGIKDLNNYSNTSNFIKTIKIIRDMKARSDIVVIAGACQSNFEALIANGADFASSPKRINIHTFDPAVIAIKVATTSFLKVVNLSEALRYIDKGAEAFGGIETLGKMKLFV